jgi:hypothetical protein
MGMGTPNGVDPSQMKGGSGGAIGSTGTSNRPQMNGQPIMGQPVALSGFAPGAANGLFGISQGYNGGMGSVSPLSSQSNPQNPNLAQGGAGGFAGGFPAQLGGAGVSGNSLGGQSTKGT